MNKRPAFLMSEWSFGYDALQKQAYFTFKLPDGQTITFLVHPDTLGPMRQTIERIMAVAAADAAEAPASRN